MILRRRKGREQSFDSWSDARRDDLAGPAPSFDGHVRCTDAGVRGSGSRHRCQPCRCMGASFSEQSASLRQENARKRHFPRTKRNLSHMRRVKEKPCRRFGAAGTSRAHRHCPSQSRTATLSSALDSSALDSSALDAVRSRAYRAVPNLELSATRIASAAFRIAPSMLTSEKTPAQIEAEKARFVQKSGRFVPDAALFVPDAQTLRVGLRSGSQSQSENRFSDGRRLSSDQDCPSTQARPSSQPRPSIQPRPHGAGDPTARETTARRVHDDARPRQPERGHGVNRAWRPKREYRPEPERRVESGQQCLDASMEAGIEAGAIAMCPGRPPRKPLRVKCLGDKLGYPQATFVPPLILLHQP
jgi:hypothetical protein